jgi:hypothetical protein
MNELELSLNALSFNALSLNAPARGACALSRGNALSSRPARFFPKSTQKLYRSQPLQKNQQLSP